MKFCLEGPSPKLLVACFAWTKQRRLPKFHSDLPLRVFPRGSRRWIWLLACSTLAAAFTARWTWTTTPQWTWPWVLSALPFCCGWYLLPVEKKREREKRGKSTAASARKSQPFIHLFICDTFSPAQVTQRCADLRQRQVRAQQDQHLREGLPARRQRRDLHVGHRVFQHHCQDAHFSHAGSRWERKQTHPPRRQWF